MKEGAHVYIFGIGSGIGQGLYQRFLEDKSVSLFGFSRSGSQTLGSFPKEEKGSFVFDAKNPNDLETFRKSLPSKYGSLSDPSVSTPSVNPVDLLVYYALGDGVFGPISGLEESDLKSHFDLNVHALILIAKAFGPYLPFFRSSTFVFLGSTAGKQGFPESVAYCASKHAVLGVARALREEWKPIGTKVIHVSLGAVATEIWDTRPQFDKNDMVSISDISEYLWSISHLPKSIFVDDLSITPRKGIL
ncbi:SDR family oxidoreductase [Leptospira sp. 2 VSF19]|uniref:SDR family oxidoreductase n=1 Tax=Leptospira soteropolitanensis TaxID=2950025 RepID=A0AAW5VFB6_9LEPT|nr:SDR family oxidoreductase [Leptospira soteropolitanensis]MCW7492633.1 SDR family oxidoreductase [Leptospira soteropolitanensis]MCW7500316.1 SDR family oxidoreductase [Leptospira soteropolitanensis]MCW7522649.1 SDR family oxidoreductase [Leptospira soteropolitanensis]MCW7526505.1 SDR family oxidoreductase [Leptospira soteropolitanensis]MCW7530286.1 SDR family oxidoreductase [Leptospira soteropolitanensis]